MARFLHAFVSFQSQVLGITHPFQLDIILSLSSCTLFVLGSCKPSWAVLCLSENVLNTLLLFDVYVYMLLLPNRLAVQRFKNLPEALVNLWFYNPWCLPMSVIYHLLWYVGVLIGIDVKIIIHQLLHSSSGKHKHKNYQTSYYSDVVALMAQYSLLDKEWCNVAWENVLWCFPNNTIEFFINIHRVRHWGHCVESVPALVVEGSQLSQA